MNDWKQRHDDARKRAAALEEWARWILAETIENPQHLRETPAELRGATVRSTEVNTEKTDAEEGEEGIEGNEINSVTASVADVRWFERYDADHGRCRGVVLAMQPRGSIHAHDDTNTFLVYCETKTKQPIGWIRMEEEGALATNTIIAKYMEIPKDDPCVVLLRLEPQ